MCIRDRVLEARLLAALQPQALPVEQPEDNVTVLRLLDGERLGLECSEETGFQYQPEQTTSALICHHPQAKYFVAR